MSKDIHCYKCGKLVGRIESGSTLSKAVRHICDGCLMETCLKSTSNESTTGYAQMVLSMFGIE